MSVLVVQIPPRQRLRAQSAVPMAARAARRDYVYAYSSDGLIPGDQGECPASLLPKADQVVAVLGDSDVAWHRIVLPKAPTARLRMALVGVLEEALLEDVENTHLAVAPQSTAGQPTWIAAVDRNWLRDELAALAQAQVFVDRVVPVAWPDELPHGHFWRDDELPGDDPVHQTMLTWSQPQGVAVLRLQGALPRAVVAQASGNTGGPPVRWTATPAAASAAERWLEQPLTVVTPAQRLLQASRTLWNLRQFELARKNRGSRAAQDAWREFMGPRWRPTRYGLLALVGVQLIGLNLWAAQLNDAINDKRAGMVTQLQTAFPQVRAVLDAPLQMQREVQSLRAQAGKASDTDLEPLLAAAASAWPPDRPPVDNLRYEAGRLSLAASGWSEPQIEQYREQLRQGGWLVESADGRLVISRAPGAHGGAL